MLLLECFKKNSYSCLYTLSITSFAIFIYIYILIIISCRSISSFNIRLLHPPLQLHLHNHIPPLHLQIIHWRQNIVMGPN